MMLTLDPGANTEGKARPNHEEDLPDARDPSTLVSLYSDDLVLPDLLDLMFVDSDGSVLPDDEFLRRWIVDTFVRVTFVVVEVLAEPSVYPLDESSVESASLAK
jgi:hypothetical protein